MDENVTNYFETESTSNVVSFFLTRPQSRCICFANNEEWAQIESLVSDIVFVFGDKDITHRGRYYIRESWDLWRVGTDPIDYVGFAGFDFCIYFGKDCPEETKDNVRKLYDPRMYKKGT